MPYREVHHLAQEGFEHQSTASKTSAYLDPVKPRVTHRRLLRFAAVCLLGLTAPVYADDFERGMQAYQRTEYRQAWRLWRPLAENGDRFAQLTLGLMYHDGKGVEKDEAKATAWFQRAADQGLAPAEFNLGNAYRFGRGVAQSDEKAVYWWRKAAIQNFSGAQFNLGTAYLYGRGVAPDREEALKWYRRAAANGHPVAKEHLAKEAGKGNTQQAPKRKSVRREPSKRPAPQPAVAQINKQPWVLAQDPGHFTIQLLSGTNPDAVPSYVERYQVTGTLAVCGYRQKGQDRVALLYGTFPDRKTAEAALAALPPEVRKASPWIRRFRDLQSAVAVSTPVALH